MYKTARQLSTENLNKKDSTTHVETDQRYHPCNRCNNNQTIFFTDANYLYFLQKIKTELKKYYDILCYCLMPNHFHVMLVPNNEGCGNLVLAGKETRKQNLSKTISKTLSSFTKAINLQNNSCGNIFQKKQKLNYQQTWTLLKVDLPYGITY